MSTPVPIPPLPGPEEADAETLGMIADAVAAYAVPDAARTRRVRDSAEGFDAKVWRDMAEQGWLGVLVPEGQGGLALGLEAAAAIARRLGYAAFPEPYVPVAVLAARVLARAPESALRDDLLARLVAGDLLPGVAWQGVRGGIDVTGTHVRAVPAGDGVHLGGESRFIPVPGADGFIVSASADGGLGLYWAEAGQEGVDVAAERAADGTRSLRVTFSDALVPAENCLAAPGEGAAILRAALAEATVAASAEMTGLIERALDITLDYLRTREQFNRPIGSFQALQHRAVDLWIQKELARTTLDATVRALAGGAGNLDGWETAASSLKARAAIAGRLVAGQSVQLHGAIGFTDEYELGVYVNRALVLAAWLGNAAEHQRRFGARAPIGGALPGQVKGEGRS